MINRKEIFIRVNAGLNTGTVAKQWIAAMIAVTTAVHLYIQSCSLAVCIRWKMEKKMELLQNVQLLGMKFHQWLLKHPALLL